jgi:hypothetical protein
MAEIVALEDRRQTDEQGSDDERKDGTPALRTFKRWFQADKDHSRDWRIEAREDYDFVAGEQWTEEERDALKEKLRPIITFNRTAPVIRAVSGYEITNRQEVRYLPREMGDVRKSELLTSAAQWFRDECDAEDEESEAFIDTCTCGMGWTESRLDYDDNPDGEPEVERIDPMEMWWDDSATKRNILDAKRLWRVRRMTVAEARDLVEGKSDVMLDASWAQDVVEDGDERPHNADQRDSYKPEDEDEDEGRLSDDKKITLVHVQWRTRKSVWRVIDPTSGQEIEVSDKDATALKKRLPMMGMSFQGVKQQRFQWRQAFIGRDVLEVSDCPDPERPTWNCITGYRDRNKGTWFGLVRSMKDPQRWANKWLSQALHILNSGAKGGVMAEESALGGMTSDFKESWARNDLVTVVPDGTLSGPNGKKIEQKPVAPIPAGFYQLMEFAISSVRDTTGVSLELLGMREANQPIGLEQVRKQSGMAILATLFDSLRRYRKQQGRLMLHYITNYLSDGRLVRIVGEEGEQYVPLIHDTDVKYDIIVDDSPTSPNQKEMVWAMLTPLLPSLPPQVQLAVLEYSPFPTSVIEKVKKAAGEAMQQAQQAEQAKAGGGAPNPLDMVKAQAEQVKMQTDVQESQAKVAKDMASAQLTEVKAQNEALKRERDEQKARLDTAMQILRMSQMQQSQQAKSF